MKTMVFTFKKYNDVVEKQNAEQLLAIADEIDRAVREINMSLGTMEWNGKKPETCYRHDNNAKFILKNLASDLRADARL